MPRRPFFTIGYEFVTQAELIAALQDHGVRRVIDARDVANSRRAGSSKKLQKRIVRVGADGQRIEFRVQVAARNSASPPGSSPSCWRIVEQLKWTMRRNGCALFIDIRT